MPEFNDNISQIRRNMGLSREAFAEPLGVSADKIRHIETGKQRADHEVLGALRTVYGVDLNELFEGEIGSETGTASAPSFVTVPKYTVSASAGNGGSFVSDPLEITHYAFQESWIKGKGLDPKMLHIVRVKGDSMEPKLIDGDLILVDRAQAMPSDGSTYVVRIWDELVVKHVQRTGKDSISLISANKVYPPRELDLPLDEASFEIIGRVVASMHEWP
ncbi:XRE family transcriptional regulator [Sulfitobacter delicatus]|nr:S24 family peptidase [Sulfitobacter delicatus]